MGREDQKQRAVFDTLERRLRGIIALCLVTCALSFAQQRPAAAKASSKFTPPSVPKVNFGDIAERAGLTAKTEDGNEKSKKYIIETTGSGAAFFDFDNDGWPDIFQVNGSKLEGFP